MKRELHLFNRSFFSIAVAVLAAFCAMGRAFAATPDVFSLGQSSSSGAVCQTARSYDDPAAQVPYAKAWIITCRGWSDVPLGHVYTFVSGDPSPSAPGSLWRKALEGRAACGRGEPVNITGLSRATRTDCQSVPGRVPYSVYEVSDGGTIVVSEGMAALSDLLELALKVAAGTSDPPAATARLQSGAQFSRNAASNLTAAADAAQRSPEFLRQRAFIQNQGWIFDDAERDFRLLAAADNISPSDRAYAQINWALNVSNQGRFAETERHFAEAAATAAMLKDTQFDALTLNYRALDFLNQRKFAEAEAAANRAVALRGEIDPLAGAGNASDGLVATDMGLQITPSLSANLNRRGNMTAFEVTTLTAAERMQVQNAQAYYVIGTARLRTGDAASAIENLERADMILANPRLTISAVWLRARVLDELSRTDLQAGRAEEARMRLLDAVKAFQLRRDLAVTPAEAVLYLSIARIEAESGATDQALADYATGFDLFRQSRGTVGDSADGMKPYFDLLIAQSRSDPAHAHDYQRRFFDAIQSLVSQASAQTIARLAARFSQTGTAAGAARAFEDAQRQFTIKSSEIQRRQEAGDYSAQLRDADNSELKVLNDRLQGLQQQLLQANPRYGQLLATTTTLDDLQKALRPGELYFKITLLGDAGYAMAVSNQDARIYAIPLTRAQGQSQVTALRHPFDTTGSVPRFDVVLSHNLYTLLFGPVQDLMASTRHLIYDPDGALISFPAAAFVVDDASVTQFRTRQTQFQMGRYNIDLYENIGWLGRNTEVSLAVSPSAFLQARAFQSSRARYAFLGLGDPVIEDKSDPRLFRLVSDPANGADEAACKQARTAMANGLPNTGMGAIITTIGEKLHARPEDIVLGSAFTDTAVLDRPDLNNFKVVFFGTHGLLPTKNDCLPEPALVTSLGAGESDALLDASEILDLKLDADLVVLAACNTGGAGAESADRTGLSGSGEALGGLARDFIYAGSRSLIVSQWEVDREATTALMGALFDGEQGSQGDAFRRAQLSLMSDKKFSHPYYWAAFSLVGDAMRPMPGN
jgi:CHAT domain-containing protein